MDKFRLESKYLVSGAAQKKKDFNGGIKIHDGAWAWLTQMRSRTGMPVAQIVDAMVAFCDANLEIVPIGERSCEARERSTADILAEINALMDELDGRLRREEDE